MKQKIESILNVSGMLSLPGDKSISHRSVLFSSMAKGKSVVYNFLNSADVISSIDCMRALGAEIEISEDKLIIYGKGRNGFVAPEKSLYAGNSGTTARLISGILAAQNFKSEIIGDESLSLRPMKRITEPLSLMGAEIESTEGHLPLKIYPSSLHNIEYTLPVASAQVKSALILAGIHLTETTTIIEPLQCRNHTEVMLNIPVKKSEKGNVIEVNDSFYPEAKEYIVPADISTAAFFIVLGLISKDSELILKNVLLNETRAGIIEVLKAMGGDIEIVDFNEVSGEKAGDLIVRSSELRNVEIPEAIVPNIIDEIPILSVAGLFADGTFEIRNASELRAKESDRIKSLVENYKLLGVEVSEFPDGFSLSGEFNSSLSPVFNSFGDHRIAMTFSILSTQLENGGTIENFDSVVISNPQFLSQLKSIAKF